MKAYKTDQYFEFTFQTQRFDTGAATDADALPTYRVYEENNDAVIASGDTAKRDDANTTGYYYVRAQCTAAAGYEVGKTYEVRVAATVNSVAGAGVVGRFAIIPAPVWDSLYGGTDSLQVDAIEISGDSTAADNCELMFDGTGYAGGTVKLGVDAVALSGDSTAADNLEAACDGGTYNVGGGAVVAASVTAAVVLPTGTADGQISLSSGAVALQANQDIRNVSGSVSGSVASVTGDVGGKVLGGGAGTISGTGVRAVDAAGNNVAPASTALTNATWTDAKATYLDAAITSRSSHSAADIWSVGTRTLTAFGTVVADVATAVWAAATRTLSAFGFSVTAGTVSDKTGYSLHTDYDAAKTAAPAGTALSNAVWTNAKAAFLDQAVSAGGALTSAERNATADAILARVLSAESYAADGAVPTLSQILYMLWSAIGDFSISGTTITCKKLNGTTTSMTFTLDDATNPTSRTRAT